MTNELDNEWRLRTQSFGDPLVRAYEAGMMRLEGLELPVGPLRKMVKDILIEGAFGDAARNRYWPALREHIRHQTLKLWAVDVLDAGDFRSANGSRQKLEQHLEEMKALGVVYLNKRSERDHHIYKNLTVDGVIVSNWDELHCQTAQEWLGRAKWIFIEKPLDSSVEQIEAFEKSLSQYGGEVFPLGFDHYRTKALPVRQMIRSVIGWLGGEPEEVTFYLL